MGDYVLLRKKKFYKCKWLFYYANSELNTVIIEIRNLGPNDLESNTFVRKF